MRRLALAGLLALLVAVVFAPAAVAQMHEDNMMMNDDNMMMSSASASASAMSSASASASATSSASAMGDQMMGGKGHKMMSASASASPLPRTGGMPLMPLLSAAALALMAGSGIVAAKLVRRSS